MNQNMKYTRLYLIGGLCLVCLIGAVIPAAAAPVNGSSWKDNPEHISAMQAHVAYAGAKGEAQMNGAITYICSISSGAGTASLTAIQSQYAGTVSSVQSMTTSDEIKGASTQMASDEKSFMSTAKDELKQYNGTAKALRASINASVEAQSGTLQGLLDAYWTARTTARMDEFTANDQKRVGILANLTAKGIDVSAAQQIENQIQQDGAVLRSALDSRNEASIRAANEDLATLNKQFAETIKNYRASAHAKKTTAAATATPAGSV